MSRHSTTHRSDLPIPHSSFRTWHSALRTPHSRPRSAFTLLEVILALGLTVIVIGLISMAINNTLKLVDSGQGRTQRDQLARAILSKIAADVRSTLRYQPFDTTGMMSVNVSTSSTGGSTSSDEFHQQYVRVTRPVRPRPRRRPVHPVPPAAARPTPRPPQRRKPPPSIPASTATNTAYKSTSAACPATTNTPPLIRAVPPIRPAVMFPASATPRLSPTTSPAETPPFPA